MTLLVLGVSVCRNINGKPRGISETLFIFTLDSVPIVGRNALTATKPGLYTQRGKLKRYRMRNRVLIVGFVIWVDGASAFLSVI